MINYTNATVAN